MNSLWVEFKNRLQNTVAVKELFVSFNVLLCE